MTIRSILLGVVVALLVVLPQIAWSLGSGFFSPYWMLLVPVILIVMERSASIWIPSGSRLAGPRYTGLSNLVDHVQQPPSPGVSVRWWFQGFTSLLLSTFGGSVGTEGASTELAQEIAVRSRSRTANWFEIQRRTDAAVVLAAAVSASFFAPFAGAMLPIEMGVGGRKEQTVLAALTALVVSWSLQAHFGLFSLRQLWAGEEWPVLSEPSIWLFMAIAIVAAVFLGTGAVLLVRWGGGSFEAISGGRSWLRFLAGGLVLFAIAWVFAKGHRPPQVLMEPMWNGSYGNSELVALTLSKVLSLVVILAVFGTVGVLWPIFCVGVGGGAVAASWVFGPEWAQIGSVIGVAALWGGVLRAPFSIALIAFEASGSMELLVLAGVAAWGASALANWIHERLTLRSLHDGGRDWKDGLESVRVREVMSTDHEVVHEHSPLEELRGVLEKSRYPFLPVVDNSGKYVGLVTGDMISGEAERKQDKSSEMSNTPLLKLIEARDLIYRFGSHTPCVQMDDTLASVAGLFEETPAAAVVDQDSRVIGLLFGFQIRITVEKEMARRSLGFKEIGLLRQTGL